MENVPKKLSLLSCAGLCIDWKDFQRTSTLNAALFLSSHFYFNKEKHFNRWPVAIVLIALYRIKRFHLFLFLLC